MVPAASQQRGNKTAAIRRKCSAQSVASSERGTCQLRSASRQGAQTPGAAQSRPGLSGDGGDRPRLLGSLEE